MKTLIVGGAGYLGVELCSKFVERGQDFTVVDTLIHNQGPYVGHIMTDRHCTFHQTDCMSTQTAQLIKEADHIYWLAALVGGPACDKDKKEAQRVNIDSVKWLLDKASKNQRITYLCSSSGYGRANKVCTETTPMESISFYGLSKEVGEQIIMKHPRATSLRLATVWGQSRRMRLDLIVNDLTFKAFKHRKLELYQGDYLRSYVHIKDVVETLYRFSMDTRVDNNIYNVGTDNCTKTNLIEEIRKWLPATEISYSDQKDYDDRSYYLDCSKIENLGYKFKYNLADNLPDLIKYYHLIRLENAETMRNV